MNWLFRISNHLSLEYVCGMCMSEAMCLVPTYLCFDVWVQVKFQLLTKRVRFHIHMYLIIIFISRLSYNADGFTRRSYFCLIYSVKVCIVGWHMWDVSDHKMCARNAVGRFLPRSLAKEIEHQPNRNKFVVVNSGDGGNKRALQRIYLFICNICAHVGRIELKEDEIKRWNEMQNNTATHM